MTLYRIVGAWASHPRLAGRLAFGAAAFVLADFIVGLAAFSVIALGSLWFFSLGWIRLQQEYAARSLSFGAPWQLGLAWLGLVVCLPMLLGTIYLATRAWRLPSRVYRLGSS